MARLWNAEAGMPTAAAALTAAAQELATCRARGEKVLKIIHGYGSSGKGGRLRTALRDWLRASMRTRHIQLIVPGEKFSIFEEDARRLLAADPTLREDRDLDRYNNGVTFVLLD